MKHWVTGCAVLALLAAASTTALAGGDPPTGPTQVTVKVDGLKDKEAEGKLIAELKKIDGVTDCAAQKGTVVLAVGEEKTFKLTALKNILKDLSTDEVELKIDETSVALKGEVQVEITGMDLAGSGADWAGTLKGLKDVKKVEPVKDTENKFKLTIGGSKGVALEDLNAALAKLSDGEKGPSVADVTWFGPPKGDKPAKG